MAKGMGRPIEVKARSEQVELAKPKADATVKLLDFSFILPAEIKAGPPPHEILLIKLADGKTMAEVEAFMQSPHGAPPFASVGGFQAIHPGETGWLHLDLTPGHEHLELGMILPFTIK